MQEQFSSIEAIASGVVGKRRSLEESSPTVLEAIPPKVPKLSSEDEVHAGESSSQEQLREVVNMTPENESPAVAVPPQRPAPPTLAREEPVTVQPVLAVWQIDTEDMRRSVVLDDDVGATETVSPVIQAYNINCGRGYRFPYAYRADILAYLINFMFRLSLYYKLHESTVFFAVNIFYQYASSIVGTEVFQSLSLPERRTKLVKYSLTCLRIAIKLNETQSPRTLMIVDSLLFDSRRLFPHNITKEDLRKSEFVILDQIEWNAGAPTPQCYLQEMKTFSDLSDESSAIMLCLLNRLMYEPTMLVHDAPTVAASVVAIARFLTGKPAWNNQLSTRTGVAYDLMHPCICQIVYLLAAESCHKCRIHLRAVFPDSSHSLDDLMRAVAARPVTPESREYYSVLPMIVDLDWLSLRHRAGLETVPLEMLYSQHVNPLIDHYSRDVYNRLVACPPVMR